MEHHKKNDKFKLAIIILAVLLGISSVSLAGMLVYKHVVPSASTSVIVPDNIIVPSAESEKINLTVESSANNENSTETHSSVEVEQILGVEVENKVNGQQNNSSPAITNTNVSVSSNKIATKLSLHNKATEDNVPFQAVNMFPGDAETNYFCVQVSYQEGVTVRFGADIRSGYEKFAEVLKCKVVLLSTGEILYDGLMKDMPASLDHYLYSAEGTTSELYYEITAYLDTSVRNEYQNKALVADLHWWVDGEEQEHLIEAPKTGDEANMHLYAGLWITSLCMLLLLWTKAKKEVQHESK